ncbi:tRNA N6-adenosine threonylcarbamoyltransferase [Candidatus Filomicrobium marinum]|uniref:tRNA N6-adenosine threonylcarbamoyltransferase n=1 Tax=Candidatus Filomicrobium marinum TaxID=1608628 RepID=A0A0D6JCN3_9HYPH|nr:tRNA N6-adenosine threonylcarbamoyltransferase [Candidatus Filomicrobium marinum]CPR17270.1 tRNA N6-adenosine threonylcarbamoyltransferase [Candidatus Filomicrobium marinum]
MSPSEMAHETIILGIETSCDETAAAVVARDSAGRGRILSSIVRSQWDSHRPFGGVVPEIAARAHAECLDELIRDAMAEAGIGFERIDAVSAAAGPGLIGGLIVGVVTAKTIALVRGIPLVTVNHLEAHALTVGLTDGLDPPYLLLLVSGGHTQLLLVHGVDHYTRLGTTIDDALGEAFDKTAKLLGLPQPGGPSVEKAAKQGDASRFVMPRPMLGREEAHFSFAGLKTAVRQRALQHAPLSDNDVNDLCAGFEAAVLASVADRCGRAFDLAAEMLGEPVADFVVAGGVAANQALRQTLRDLAESRGSRFHVPPVELCGDNAAMIAWAGAERLARGLASPLDAKVHPRWPLDATAPRAIGAGVKA